MPMKEQPTQHFIAPHLDWVRWGKEPETQELLKQISSDIASLKDGIVQGALTLSLSVGINAGRCNGYEEVKTFIVDRIKEQEAAEEGN